jgi:hypothetical protein
MGDAAPSDKIAVTAFAQTSCVRSVLSTPIVTLSDVEFVVPVLVFARGPSWILITDC